jgi:RNA polymerase subunit RPABC4/transcription elongation factor Spt4
MNVDAFLEQARHHSEQSGLEGVAKALLFVLYTWELQHPQVVFRGKGLDVWVKSGAFDTIMSGRYSQDATGGSKLGAQRRCRGCDTLVSTTVRFCPNCGNDLQGSGPATPAPSASCAKCGSLLARGAKFCADCGAPVP